MTGFGSHHQRMPALAPTVTDERDALLTFLDQQREAILAAPFGLTEAQARSAPSPSALSLAGLIRHVATGERGWIVGVLSQRFADLPELPEDDPQCFQVPAEETVASLSAAYRLVAAETEDIVRALPSLDVEVPLPDAPWFPPGAKVSARWILLHLIEETARHAGHADIVREAIDGANAFELLDRYEAAVAPA